MNAAHIGAPPCSRSSARTDSSLENRRWRRPHAPIWASRGTSSIAGSVRLIHRLLLVTWIILPRQQPCLDQPFQAVSKDIETSPSSERVSSSRKWRRFPKMMSRMMIRLQPAPKRLQSQVDRTSRTMSAHWSLQYTGCNIGTSLDRHRWLEVAMIPAGAPHGDEPGSCNVHEPRRLYRGPDSAFVSPPWSAEVAKAWADDNVAGAGHLIYGRVDSCSTRATGPRRSRQARPRRDGSTRCPRPSSRAPFRAIPAGRSCREERSRGNRRRIKASTITGDVYCFGGAGLANNLMAEDLVDEYRLMITPALFGGGKRLFEAEIRRASLTLLEARPLDVGSIILRYRRNRDA